MNLTQENLQQIIKMIEESPITRAQMKDNIIDHLCCAIEQRISQGQNFEHAIGEALAELAPNGLKGIEVETYFLLNFKMINMKKFVYSSGLIFCISASVGLFLKTLRWPGANELLILGLGGAAIVFIPLFYVIQNQQGSTRTSLERKKDLLAFVSFMLISIGGVLKLLHTAGANEALLLGTTAFSLGYLPLFFLQQYRKSVAR